MDRDLIESVASLNSQRVNKVMMVLTIMNFTGNTVIIRYFFLWQ